MRILMNPTPEQAGGGEPAPQPAGAAPTIAVTPEQFQAYIQAANELSQIKAQQQQAALQAEAERQKVLMEKGQAEAALSALKAQYEPQIAGLNERAEKYRQRLAGETLGKAVAEAFAGVTFVSDAAREQALEIAAKGLEAAEGPDGGFQAQQKGTGIPARDHLKALIDSPAFAHFLAPSGRGGSGATNPPPAGLGRQAPPQLGGNPVESALLQSHLARINPTPGIPGFGRSVPAKP